MCTVATAPGAPSVRVWEIMLRGWGHEGGDRCRSVLMLPTLPPHHRRPTLSAMITPARRNRRVRTCSYSSSTTTRGCGGLSTASWRAWQHSWSATTREGARGLRTLAAGLGADGHPDERASHVLRRARAARRGARCGRLRPGGRAEVSWRGPKGTRKYRPLRTAISQLPRCGTPVSGVSSPRPQ